MPEVQNLPEINKMKNFFFSCTTFTANHILSSGQTLFDVLKQSFSIENRCSRLSKASETMLLVCDATYSQQARQLPCNSSMFVCWTLPDRRRKGEGGGGGGGKKRNPFPYWLASLELPANHSCGWMERTILLKITPVTDLSSELSKKAKRKAEFVYFLAKKKSPSFAAFPNKSRISLGQSL